MLVPLDFVFFYSMILGIGLYALTESILTFLHILDTNKESDTRDKDKSLTSNKEVL